MDEDRNHLFVKCDFFSRLWSLVANWIGLVLVGHDLFDEHQMQFGALGGFAHRDRILLMVLEEKDSL